MLLFYSGADTDWSVERKREYFDWAKRIVDGLSAPNQMLKAEFERLYGQSESLRSS
jgi:guanosine-3',5'-bis(diphosphate) 3'-pyrophosphohydrolase